MENATKALLIAAAVLVTILVISLGLVIYNKASEAVDGVDMSANQIQAFNEKFEQYNGTRRGSEIKAMMKTVFNHNLEKTASGEGDLYVKVTGIVTLNGSETSYSTDSINTGAMYTVTLNYDANTGLINSINCSVKNGQTNNSSSNEQS